MLLTFFLYSFHLFQSFIEVSSSHNTLKLHFSDEVPHLKEFKKYCRNYLQNSNPERRPNLSEVLKDNFFNHEFISIYKFLNVLPLKTEEEKSEFFSNILSNLKCYDEVTVAKQLGGLLLSRVTLLDQTARRDVLPFLLKPKNGIYLICFLKYY